MKIKEDKLLRALADSLKEGLLIMDPSGRIVFWNQGAEKIFGYTEQDILGKSAVDLFSEESHQEEYKRRFNEFLKAGLSVTDLDTAEFFVRDRDGKTVPLEINISRVELEGDDYVMVVLRDIAPRKSAERALFESETRFQLFERHMTDVIWMTDLEFMLTYISPSLYYQTGFRPEEVLSKPLGILITPESMQRAFELLAEELSRADDTFVDPPIPVSMVVEQLRKDGSTFWSEVRAGFLRRPDGTPYGGLGIARDITERVQLEEREREKAAALAAAEVSERYAAELKDIITIAAHELRLPATVFKGYSKVLLEHRNELDDAAIDKALSEIHAASVRLNNMVADLFETSLIEQGRISLRRASVSPPYLLRQAAEGMSPRRLEGRLNIRPGEPRYPVEVDTDRICRVLTVLMDNALKYSPQDSQVEAWFEQDQTETRFHVLDRGPGIPETDREKVFIRFFQVGDVDHHSQAGLGLGLYIARSIVEKHGGWIRVTPGEEAGSVFSFGLPRHPERLAL